MQPQHDEACEGNYMGGRFFWRPRVSYDSLIGEPVPFDHIELVLAMRRVERERDAERNEHLAS